jgi:hypothetical protein
MEAVSMNYPHRPYAVFFGENPNGTYTAWIGNSSFDGTREECLAWLKSESPEAYGCPDDPSVAPCEVIDRRA